MKLVLASLLLMLLAGCATTADREAGDPLGGINRVTWAVNDAADTVILRPATVVYRTITPRPARRGLSRILDNLSEPFSAINALLQGKPKRAVRSLGRFAINTTLGVGGLADHATGMGIRPAPEDFGQTMASWGVRQGPYLVLPLLGPSSFREAVGLGVAQMGDPYRYGLRHWSGLSQTQRSGVMAAEVLDTRSRLIESGADDALKSSMDPYATARSAWQQRRAALIADRDDPGPGIPDETRPDAELDQALDEAEADAAADAPANPPANSGTEAAPEMAPPASPPPPAEGGLPSPETKPDGAAKPENPETPG